ncbi:MAG: quinone oxidoreductase [Arenicellales bacterium]|nr:quinone oxidoreductase [Arenicellales bacterium]
MTMAIQVHQVGGPEQMKWEQVSMGSPGQGEILIEQTAVGLNFIDVYHRTGLYPPHTSPFSPGMEAAGHVISIGSGVTDLKEGDRVAYASLPVGAYTEQRIMPADRVVKIPDGIDDQTAAAMMLKGMTAHYLLRRCYAVQPGDTILFHAAAGGVGLIACQWAKHLGATVIGTVGNPDKAALAKAHGCDYPILYKEQDFLEEVRRITDGAMLPVVYDSIGRDTFDRSLDCLRPLGTMVLFGQSSGKVPPLDVGVLAAKGSLFLTRPTLMTYTAQHEDLVTAAGELFDVVAQGVVKINVHQTYALKDAGQAHIDLEARKTVGSTVLLP